MVNFHRIPIGRFINADTIDLVLASQTTLTDKNLYAYCDNNPVVRRDESGAIWETVFDVISLAASIAEVIDNPKDVWAWAGLVGDAIDLIPIVTGVGEVVRGLKLVNKVDNVVGASSTIKKGWKLGDDITNLTKAGKIPSWSTVRQRFWKNEALNNSVKYSSSNVDRMKKGLAPIGIDGYSMELHHPEGRNGENYWNFYPVTYTEHKKIHYGR